MDRPALFEISLFFFIEDWLLHSSFKNLFHKKMFSLDLNLNYNRNQQNFSLFIWLHSK